LGDRNFGNIRLVDQNLIEEATGKEETVKIRKFQERFLARQGTCLFPQQRGGINSELPGNVFHLKSGNHLTLGSYTALCLKTFFITLPRLPNFHMRIGGQLSGPQQSWLGTQYNTPLFGKTHTGTSSSFYRRTSSKNVFQHRDTLYKFGVNKQGKRNKILRILPSNTGETQLGFSTIL